VEATIDVWYFDNTSKTTEALDCLEDCMSLTVIDTLKVLFASAMDAKTETIKSLFAPGSIANPQFSE
jgi:hypothetical protein